MRPYEPFDVTFYLDSPYMGLPKGENTFQVDNMKALIEFAFSINPELFYSSVYENKGLSLVDRITFSQAGKEIGSLFYSPGAFPEVKHTGFYLSLTSPVEDFIGITGYSLDTIPVSRDHDFLLLAKFHSEVNMFQWTPGYMRVRAETQMTQGANAIHPNHHQAAVFEFQSRLTAEGWRQHVIRSFLPSIQHAHQQVLATNLKLFDNLANIKGSENERDFCIDSIAVHTDSLMDDDFLIHRIAIEEIGGDHSGIVPGIYLQLNAEKWASFAEFDEVFKWDFGQFKYAELSDVHFLLAEESYVRSRIIEQDPYLQELAQHKAHDIEPVPYRLEVEGLYPSRSVPDQTAGVTDRFYYPTIFPALQHLFNINTGGVFNSSVVEFTDGYEVKGASIYYEEKKLLSFSISADSIIHIQPRVEFAKISNHSGIPGIGHLPGAIDGFYLPDNFIAGYHEKGSKVFRPTSDFLRVQSYYRHQSTTAANANLVAFMQSRLEVRNALQDKDQIEGKFVVVYAGRQQINAHDRNVCRDFEAAYRELATLPAEALQAKSTGGYGKVSIVDHSGNTLVTRFEHPGDNIIPKGIYTMVHTDNITPEILGGISKDLTIVDHKTEYFLCRAIDGDSVQLKRQPSPLRIQLKESGSGLTP